MTRSPEAMMQDGSRFVCSLIEPTKIPGLYDKMRRFDAIFNGTYLSCRKGGVYIVYMLFFLRVGSSSGLCGRRVWSWEGGDWSQAVGLVGNLSRRKARAWPYIT